MWAWRSGPITMATMKPGWGGEFSIRASSLASNDDDEPHLKMDVGKTINKSHTFNLNFKRLDQSECTWPTIT